MMGEVEGARPEKITYGCCLSALTGLGELSPAPPSAFDIKPLPYECKNFYAMNNTVTLNSREAMKKIISICTVTILITGCMGSTSAQGDWWTQTQKVLNSDAGKTVMDQLGGASGVTSALSNTEIIAGLKEALSIGSEKVVSQLGVSNGFNLDPKIHIPLPGQLQRVDKALSAIGMNSLTEDLDLRLNRAAEAATPKAKALFLSAIQNMTIEDAKGILTGPQDSATQYLRRAMGPQLSQDMQPLVGNALAQAGAIRAYDNVMGQYEQIPFMPDVKANLNNYVIGKTLDGIFYYVAAEEAAIRTNPAARTTELLKKVFAK